jgi:hypothetical protein
MTKQPEVRDASDRAGVQRTAQVRRARHSLHLRLLPALAVAVTALAAPRTAAASPRTGAGEPVSVEYSPRVAGSDTAAEARVNGTVVTSTTTRREWYRLSLGLAYGIPVTGLATAAAAESDAALGVAAVGLLVPPIVHMSHGNVGRGFGSLGGMAGLGLVGLLVGLSADPPQICFDGLLSDDSAYAAESNCRSGQSTGAVVGVALGISVWAAIDVAFLAYEDVPVEQGVSFSPWLSPVVGSSARLGGAGQSNSITGMQVGALGTF